MENYECEYFIMSNWFKVTDRNELYKILRIVYRVHRIELNVREKNGVQEYQFSFTHKYNKPMLEPINGVGCEEILEHIIPDGEAIVIFKTKKVTVKNRIYQMYQNVTILTNEGIAEFHIPDMIERYARMMLNNPDWHTETDLLFDDSKYDSYYLEIVENYYR